MILQPRRLLAVHLTIIAGLAIVNIWIGIADAMGHRQLLGLSRLMRLEEEANIPSALSSLALLACAIVASAVRSRLLQSDPDRSAWGLIALFFFFLALDEWIMIHELGDRIGFDAAFGGLLKHLGVLLYIPVLIYIAARLFPFWLLQERWLRTVLILASIIYVAGAIGCEMVEKELRIMGYDNYDLPMRISFICEECGEMLGVAVFLYAFLQRFSELGGGLLVRLAVADACEDENRCLEPLSPAHGADPETQNTLVSSRP